MTMMKYNSYGTEYELEFKRGKYHNGRTIIQVMCRELEDEWFEPFCRLTVNLPDTILSSDGSKDLPSNIAFLDSNNCPADLVMKIIEEGYMTMTRTSAQSGFCTYPLVKFNEDWLNSLASM